MPMEPVKNAYSYLGPGPTTTEGNDSEIERRIFEFLPSHACRVLELGCGNGYLAARLAEKGHRVVASDDSISGIEIARKHYGRAVNFSVSSCYAPSPPGELFDVVIAKEVIEHLIAPRILCENAFAVLRPGGMFIVTTPYHGYLKNLALSILNKWDSHHGVDWEGGHIKFFSPTTLEQTLKNAKFSSFEFKFAGRAPFLWKSMICKASK